MTKKKSWLDIEVSINLVLIVSGLLIIGLSFWKSDYDFAFWCGTGGLAIGVVLMIWDRTRSSKSVPK